MLAARGNGSRSIALLAKQSSSRCLPSSTFSTAALVTVTTEGSVLRRKAGNQGPITVGARQSYSTKGGKNVQPPGPSSSMKAASASATPPPTTPPPKPTPPPTSASSPPPPKQGMGLFSILGMGLVAAAVGGVTYYNILADDKERAKIDALLVEYGLSSPPSSSSSTSSSSTVVAKPVQKTPSETAKASRTKSVSASAAKVVKEGGEKVAAAVESVKTVVEERASAVKKEGEKVVNAAANKAHQVAEDLKEAVHKVEEAEQLAEQIIADLAEEEGKGGGEEKKSSKSTPASQKQTQAALEHFATYQDRAKDLRFETLTRAAEEALAQGEALRRHLDQTLLKDLGSLSPESLRHRVVQLAGELHERTKWEALRLHEAVKKAEVEISTKYTDLIEKLKQESTDELGRQARAFDAEKVLALQKLEAEKEKEYKQCLEAELASFTEKITATYEEQKAKAIAEVEARAKRETENAIYDNQSKFHAQVDGRLEELDKLKTTVQALDQVFKTDTDYEHLSWKVHKVTAAIMAFELKLLTSDPIKKEIEALRKVTAGDPVIETVLSALPSDVSEGVPTLSELQVRFPKVQTAARDAAFVPEDNPTLAGHMFGSVLAAVTIKPKGLVDGQGADEILARAAYHVERGDLKAGVQELEGLTGLSGKTVQDWLKDAKGRLLVQQAVKAMSARSALLNSSLI